MTLRRIPISNQLRKWNPKEKRKEKHPVHAQARLPLPFGLNPSSWIHRWEILPLLLLLNTQVEEGSLGVALPVILPKPDELLRAAMVYLQLLCQSWGITASMGGFQTPRHPLALTPIFSNDLWQVSVTSEATTLGKQVTCHWMKTRLHSKVKKLLFSSLLAQQKPLSPVGPGMQGWGEIKVIEKEIMITEAFNFFKQNLPLSTGRRQSLFRALGALWGHHPLLLG